jgi:hypothetical protein
MNRIEKFAEAIKQHEGYYIGSRSYRNNNPGNLKFVGQANAIKEANGSFCVFDTYEHGWQALINMITNAVNGKSQIYSPTMTVLQFFEKYAPSADSNDPKRYAEAVATYVGFSVNSELEELTIDPDKTETPAAQEPQAAPPKRVRITLGDKVLLEGEFLKSSSD